jgi:hypothetical protein
MKILFSFRGIIYGNTEIGAGFANALCTLDLVQIYIYIHIYIHTRARARARTRTRTRTHTHQTGQRMKPNNVH